MSDGQVVNSAENKNNLDIAFGESSASPAISEILQEIERLNVTGTLYIGYPLLAGLQGAKQVDAFLTTLEHGIVLFDIPNIEGYSTRQEMFDSLQEHQNDLFVELTAKLSEFKELRKGRNLRYEPSVISVLPNIEEKYIKDDAIFLPPSCISDYVTKCPPIDEEFYKNLNAAVQRTSTLKPKKKRENVTTSDSRGGKLKEIEKEIANLDQWQKRAAIEYPEGPQRIRGLAGSGKTVVLAQKASFLHAKFPHWTIVVTFQTRSLYQQFENLIRRFSFEQIKDEPDWSKLRIIHAWGSASSSGVYSEIAEAYSLPPKDFNYGKNNYGVGRAFGGVCDELLDQVEKRQAEEIFDVVLIDEAQDFPESFFKLVYRSTTYPKRIVWAYDELQNLSDYTMAPAEQLFGKDENEQPLVQLNNRKNQPQQDIILPVCYRNTPWALVIAHALGFGVYREQGMVQMFDMPGLWNDIGYEVVRGQLKAGQNVSLARRVDATPQYFCRLLNPDDAVYGKTFDTDDEQYNWLAQNIYENLQKDELEHDDVLVVCANPLIVRRTAASIIKALDRVGLTGHLAGVSGSRDVLFYKGHISITSIYRAKGNEAPMVYMVGAEYCHSGLELNTKRNIIFTAITRSRAWVRILGVGEGMKRIVSEIEETKRRKYHLEFKYPTEQEIKQMKTVHRDMSRDERAAIEKDLEAAQRVLERLRKGELSEEQLPSWMQEFLPEKRGK